MTGGRSLGTWRFGTAVTPCAPCSATTNENTNHGVCPMRRSVMTMGCARAIAVDRRRPRRRHRSEQLAHRARRAIGDAKIAIRQSHRVEALREPGEPSHGPVVAQRVEQRRVARVPLECECAALASKSERKPS